MQRHRYPEEPSEGSSFGVEELCKKLPQLCKRLPHEIVNTNRFVCWRKERDRNNPDKINKPPVCAVPGEDLGKIRNDCNLDSHATLGQAVALRESRKLSGIGWYVRADLDGIVGIDLDGCVFEGELTSFADEFLQRAGESTYVEVSPSGRGLRAFVRCENWRGITGGNINDSHTGIEIYGIKRYLTLTGNSLRGKGLERIAEDDGLLRWLIEKTGRSRVSVYRNGLPGTKESKTKEADSTKLVEVSQKSAGLMPPSVRLPHTKDGLVDRSTALYRIAKSLHEGRKEEAEIVSHIEKCDHELWTPPKYAGREEEYGRIAQKVASGKVKSGRNSQAVTSHSTPSLTSEAQRISLCDSLLNCAIRMPWSGTTGITDFFVYSSLLLFAREFGRATDSSMELVLDQRSHALFAGLANRDTLAKSVCRLQKKKLIVKLPRLYESHASSYEIPLPSEKRTQTGHGSFTGGEGGNGPSVCAILCQIRRLRSGTSVNMEVSDDLRITKLGGLILARLAFKSATLKELSVSLKRRARCLKSRYLYTFVKHGLVVMRDARYSVVSDLEERILSYLEASGMQDAQIAQSIRYERQREIRKQQV